MKHPTKTLETVIWVQVSGFCLAGGCAIVIALILAARHILEALGRIRRPSKPIEAVSFRLHHQIAQNYSCHFYLLTLAGCFYALLPIAHFPTFSEISQSKTHQSATKCPPSAIRRCLPHNNRTKKGSYSRIQKQFQRWPLNKKRIIENPPSAPSILGVGGPQCERQVGEDCGVLFDQYSVIELQMLSIRIIYIDFYSNMPCHWKQLSFRGICIAWKRLTIHLRRNFNTAHSSSAERTNFFLKVQLQGQTARGLGECGLPPKKPHCYLADAQDCQNFMDLLQATLAMKEQMPSKVDLAELHQSLFFDLPANTFNVCQPNSITASPHCQTFTNLLVILSEAQKLCSPEYRAARSALEFAILDLWAKLLAVSVTELMFSSYLSQQKECSSFYTLSYENHKEMIKNAVQSLVYTPFIKIKYIDDIDGLFILLNELEKVTGGSVQKYIIDANASWSLQSCAKFNQTIVQEKHHELLEKILYVEQPFPIEMNDFEEDQWRKLKAQSPVKIAVDESFSGCKDILKAVSLGHAVNIKAEKAGGPINCLRAAHLVQQHNLEIMLGSMVSTHLGCTQTYQLRPLTRWLDVDGSLLVESPIMEGGFKWGNDGFLIVPQPKSYGVQIHPSILES